MKTIIKLFFYAFLLMGSYQYAYSQSTINGFAALGHLPAANPGLYYCGWGIGSPIDFNIENRSANNINFLTGGIQRMTILGTAAPNGTAGYVGIGQPNPIFPLTVLGDPNSFVTASGWRRGILLQDHAVLAWQAPGGNSLFMGHPSFVPGGEFYCGLAPGLGAAAVPNYVYRIIGNPDPTTPPNIGDVEFFADVDNHNVLMDHYLGVGPAPANYNPANRIHITTALGDPYFNNAAGSSGLRFTNMTSAKTPMLINPNLIKAVDLTERGDGQLNIFADDLSTGIYSYALVADGNIVDAKKMEKVK